MSDIKSNNDTGTRNYEAECYRLQECVESLKYELTRTNEALEKRSIMYENQVKTIKKLEADMKFKDGVIDGLQYALNCRGR